MEKTIAAISTPPGVGGVAVIRVSGEQALEVAARVFRANADVPAMKGYTCLYGKVMDGAETVDDGVLTYFAAPHSYTGEDVVELSVHGGAYLPGRILELIFAAGAEPAGRGEFTRRAFLNGKLTLTQAEAVAELIGAEGLSAARAARAAKDGALWRAVEPLIAEVRACAALAAAYIDFPEEGTPEVEPERLMKRLDAVSGRLYELLETAEPRRRLRQGIRAAIVGRPNVGKSSLMNLLAGCRRSIVTPTPGTTRDVVEEYVSLDGLTLRLADTAGIRDAEDAAEREGVAMSEARIAESDLVLAVFDLSVPPDANDMRVIERCRDVSRETPVVAVFNKSDLPVCDKTAALAAEFVRSVTVSASESRGVEALWDAIRECTRVAALDPNAAMLANERQRSAAREARNALERASGGLAEGWTLDVVSVDVEEALAALLELTGENVSDSVIDEVFETFCVGK